MDLGMDNFQFIKTTSKYGVEMNSYHDPETNHFYIFSSNGVRCVLKQSKFIYFYRNDELLIQTTSRYPYISGVSGIEDFIDYLDLSIFLHANERVVNNLVLVLSQQKYAADLTHMLHPKQMYYFFNFMPSHDIYDECKSFKDTQTVMVSYNNEFYYTNNSFHRLNPDLNKFINRYTHCITEMYYSLETSNILFTHDLKWSVINIVYNKETSVLMIDSKPHEKYKDSQETLEETVPSVSLCISEDAMYDYVYEYLFNRSIKDLRPVMKQIFNDSGDYTYTDFNPVLKIVEMVSI